MDTMNLIVAANIRRLREERNLSMEELARLSGVSKSMLVQIERGMGNPSLSTMQKLAGGMQIPFDALLARPSSPYQLVKFSQLEPILGDQGGVKNYALFPEDENRHFSTYWVEAEPGGSWQAEPHMRGTVELITVFGGALELSLHHGKESRTFRLNRGDSICFQADVVHSYRNLSDEPLIFHNILHISRKLF